MQEKICQAHMAGQMDAGVRDPSWSNAFAYYLRNMTTAPSASPNTGSPKLPLMSEVEVHIHGVWSVCKNTDIGALLTGAQLAYDFIERQLRAGA